AQIKASLLLGTQKAYIPMKKAMITSRQIIAANTLLLRLSLQCIYHLSDRRMQSGHIPVIIYYSMPKERIFFIIKLIFYTGQHLLARQTIATGDCLYPLLQRATD